MSLPYVVELMPVAPVPDVAESQAANLDIKPCQTVLQSATVCLGRTQAAFASHEGCAIGCSDATFQENRSRGCRRARKLCWRCAWSPLWLPAVQSKPKKLSMWMSRLRPSLPTPASTNKNTGRASDNRRIRPARFTLGASRWAVDRGLRLYPAKSRLVPSALGLTLSPAYGCAQNINGGIPC